MKNLNIALLIICVLSGCQDTSQQRPSEIAAKKTRQEQAVNSGWQSADGALQVTVSEKSGIKLHDQQQTLAHISGAYKQLSVRPLGAQQWLLASIDAASDKVVVHILDVENTQLQPLLHLQHSQLLADSLCLFKDAANDSLTLFVQDGRGRAEQWLLQQAELTFAQPILTRSLAQPDDVNSCVVDDNNAHLYINEESLGIWRYNARIEDDPSRNPLVLRAPYGALPHAIGALAIADSGHLFALAKTGNEIYHWSTPAQSTEFETLILKDATADNLSISQLHKTDTGQLVLANEDSGDLYSAAIRLTHVSSAKTEMVVVKAAAETEVADRFGDAMDDPAIWVHPTNHQQSLILGTHKKRGLEVYNLSGQLVQRFDDGKLNNVDLRDGFVFNGETIALATASKRNDNSLAFYGISAAGEVRRLGSVPVELDPIYGLCMGQYDGQTFVFANDKEGHVKQYLVSSENHQIVTKLIAELKLETQPEGCVVDDQHKRLFVGEEDRGIWAAELGGNGSLTPQLIAKVGGQLVDDIEGLALSADPSPLLVVSSQGNNSYQLFSALPPYRHIGGFRVGFNGEAGVDGSSETDGLELSTRLSTPRYPQGLLVVQDGRNRMPDQPQNFKLVSWKEVKEALQAMPGTGPIQ